MTSDDAFDQLMTALAEETKGKKDVFRCIGRIEEMIERLMFVRVWLRKCLDMSEPVRPDFDYRTGMPPKVQ